MATQEPGSTGAPNGGDGEDGASSIPDEIWRKFIEDSERAILRSAAPREPSARDRGALPHPLPPHTTDTTDAVGELWQPEDPSARPSWRALDSRARRRRVGRVLGSAAAIAVLLGALAQLPSGEGGPYGGGQSEATTEQSEDAPRELPAATVFTP
ncbi:hypothetical protein [Streptomyces poonensis]|uniref:Uncharacterized protein n=1 Tax=Streptomyces poonensis TaxID=68255 RepID=A0A918UT70_9ACTN|nr:hypothetical protein [Streptomyces poonensis]GGZ32507.1 hypothetical protein GCM10010365_61670 [Streptomyces poonensis]GLJ92836.1 hypothetical protein GCM10017589_54460 [Streptomyces poonensis]